MAGKQQPQLVIVEDDLELSEMLGAYFKVQGYKVNTVAWGKKAIEICTSTPPNLILLDIRLPDIDGYEVCRQLRTFHTTRNIPIIFLTERNERSDRLAGLELGVVDYITKPFDIQELRLRARNAMRRAGGMYAKENPVTGLVEGEPVERRLEQLAGGDEEWGLLLVTLRGLNHFREQYGFVASDDVLRAASLILKNVIKESGDEDDLVGQLAYNEFVLVTGSDSVQKVNQRVAEQLASSIHYFYPLKDRLELKDNGERLSLWTGRLGASDGPFKNVEALKKAALESREEVRLPVVKS